MQLNTELGILYDITCFGDTYFNYERIEQFYQEVDIPFDIRIKPYKDILDKVGTLPSFLRLFFCAGATGEPIIAKFLDNMADDPSVGLEMFLSNFDDEKKVLEAIVASFFPELDEKTKRRLVAGEIPLWYRICGESELPTEMQMAMLYLASSYENLHLEIRKELFHLHTVMKAYHLTHEDEIDQVKKRQETPERVKRLCDQHQVDLTGVEEEDIVLGVSLMNPAMSMVGRFKNVVIFICGEAYLLPEEKKDEFLDIVVQHDAMSEGGK